MKKPLQGRCNQNKKSGTDYQASETAKLQDTVNHISKQLGSCMNTQNL